MYINKIFYKNISPCYLNMTVINDHFDSYFNDLYRIYRSSSEIKNKKGVTSYKEVASHLFDVESNRFVCFDSDYLFFPSWGLVLDDGIAIPEFYFKNKFKWKGSILDVRECGSLCVYFAVHMILSMNQIKGVFDETYFKAACYNNVESNSCADFEKISNTCCSIECQFPGDKESSEIFPEINYVGLLSLSLQQEKYSNIKILYCNIYYNNGLLDYKKLVVLSVKKVAKKYGIDQTQYSVIMRQVEKENSFFNEARSMSHPVSSGLLYCILNQILESKIKIEKPYIFIIDFDLKIYSFGVLLVKQGM